MLDRFEQNVMRDFLSNFFFATTPHKKAMAVVCDWLEENLEIISDVEPSEDFYDQLDQYQSAVKGPSGIKYSQMRVLSEMKHLLKPKRRT